MLIVFLGLLFAGLLFQSMFHTHPLLLLPLAEAAEDVRSRGGRVHKAAA